MYIFGFWQVVGSDASLLANNDRFCLVGVIHQKESIMSSLDVAKLIVREVPLGQMKALLNGQRLHPNAMGDGCGGGCGGGAGCLDPNGHSGITNDQIQAALKDKVALSKAIAEQLKTRATEF